ncbi:MAG: DUF4325 domain-containing protein [Gammaproteobacteria bacterium]|nr:DUF4325 domain-containing protein [Gammaproteobacteria bacterium]
MKTQAEIIRSFLLKNISEHPSDIVALAAQKFQVTRTTIHRHLNQLIKANKISKTGTTRQISYSLLDSFKKQFSFQIHQKLDESDIWSNYFQRTFLTLSENIYTICEYGFTEILNNAIWHSQGKSVITKSYCKDDSIILTIIDDGIGIFDKLAKTFNFEDKREGVLAISKGKLTTDPAHHTGEGLFFSSRAFDIFSISANQLTYIRNNLEQDWFLTSNDYNTSKGTTVSMTISRHSKTDLVSIFKKFQDPNTLAFDRTHILVELSKFEEERFISRSQAKRILFNLEKFRDVTLDFKSVKLVGQGFCDEIFRIFKAKHPEITIRYVNANPDIEFMIKRSIATAKL